MSTVLECRSEEKTVVNIPMTHAVSSWAFVRAAWLIIPPWPGEEKTGWRGVSQQEFDKWHVRGWAWIKKNQEDLWRLAQGAEGFVRLCSASADGWSKGKSISFQSGKTTFSKGRLTPTEWKRWRVTRTYSAWNTWQGTARGGHTSFCSTCLERLAPAPMTVPSRKDETLRPLQLGGPDLVWTFQGQEFN